MLNRLKYMFSSGRSARPEAAETPPSPEQTLYVIGDIHGRIDLLDRILTAIDEDISQHPAQTQTLILVGDYIDRGEGSAETLVRVRELGDALPENVVCLMGNHEKMLVDFLDAPKELGPRWLRNGGLQTLASYHVGGVFEQSTPDQLQASRDQLHAALPAGMEDWLRNRPLIWQSGNVICVHAGLDPAKSLEEQNQNTLIWGHRDFLKTARNDGTWIVHGHTTVDVPQKSAGRISIDTGAYYSGRLTAAKISRNGVSFLKG